MVITVPGDCFGGACCCPEVAGYLPNLGSVLEEQADSGTAGFDVDRDAAAARAAFDPGIGSKVLGLDAVNGDRQVGGGLVGVCVGHAVSVAEMRPYVNVTYGSEMRLSLGV